MNSALISLPQRMSSASGEAAVKPLLMVMGCYHMIERIGKINEAAN